MLNLHQFIPLKYQSFTVLKSNFHVYRTGYFKNDRTEDLP